MIRQRFELGDQWPTLDPFLFVAHHRDDYPSGTESMAPDASLTGRPLGTDFGGIDGWNMYHGTTVPGFPQHPHRGFETITHVRRGHIDHADSLGATARFGRGDTQWMTAGSGIVHAEMFPLLDRSGSNRLELFQIWLNLPAEDKLVDPYFTMLWSEATPGWTSSNPATEVTVIAGRFRLPDREISAPAPPPNSWAARDEADVAIWHLALARGAEIALPPAAGATTNRALYVFDGAGLTLASGPASNGVDSNRDGDAAIGVARGIGVEVDPMAPLVLAAPDGPVEAMLLQGRPIGEPVVQYGPFVMNDEAGIIDTIADYQRTGFGGWPWSRDDPVHEREAGRFARHADGRVEAPG